MPGEGEILRQDQLAIVSKAAARRQTVRGIGGEIRTAARREPEVPHFVWAKAQPAAERRIFETGLRDAPGFRARSEGGILHFRGVIETAAGAGDGGTGGVAR